MELKKQIIHKNVTPSWDTMMDGVFAHQHGRVITIGNPMSLPIGENTHRMHPE